MNGLPLGFYSGLMGLSILAMIVSGIYLLLRARNVARWMQRSDNDIVPGPRRSRRGRSTRGTKIAAAIFILGAGISIMLLELISHGVIGSEQTSNSREVQRP